MKCYNLYFACAIALIASAPVFGYQSQSGYSQLQSADAGDYQLQGLGSQADSNSANAAAAGVDSGAYSQGPSSYDNNQNVPFAPANTQGNTITSSITYPQNKGEILIHRPAAIIVKRPPTRVVVNHPPLVVKPAPVVLHKPPAVVLRKVFVKNHPRPVKVEPVYVNVVKPPAEKYFVNEKQQQQQQLLANAQIGSAPSGFAPVGAGQGSAGSLQNFGNAQLFASNAADNAAVNAGYQLLPGNQGLAALANIAGPAGSSYGSPSNY